MNDDLLLHSLQMDVIMQIDEWEIGKPGLCVINPTVLLARL